MPAIANTAPPTINCDMGESFGGFHASDPTVMARTVRLARRHGVKVGAHPSLPDLQGFGRREMKMQPEELTDCILYQVGALKAFLDREGMPLSHVKPHGSLYGMAARSPEVAKAVADAARVFAVPVFGMAGTMHEKVYGEAGLAFVSEYYADLDYGDDGTLIITREHHAVDPGRAAERALRAIREGLVASLNGKDVRVRAQSICVHSDTPNAVEVARAVKAAIAG
jgi:UPF0271 protein